MMNCVEMWKPVAVMVVVEFCMAMVNILFKKAFPERMNHIILVAYRQIICTIFLFPLAYLWERTSWSKLTVWVTGQMFLSALLGLTLSQYLFLVGLDHTSATLCGAFVNLVPVFTFILALPFGMEKVNLKRNSGQAKVFGTLTCVAGAILVILYKGIPINKQQSHDVNHKKSHGLGSVFLFGGSVCWACWYLIQGKVGKNYPYSYSSTTIMSFFSAVQSTFMCLVTQNISKWVLRGKLEILSVVYAGIVGSGICYVVMSWCVKKRGPVFTSAFSPLIQIFAAIFDVTVLHEEIYLGSILGSIIVIIGMYILLWGKSKDDETLSQVHTEIKAEAGRDLAVEVTTQ